jgi:hypothetical protein
MADKRSPFKLDEDWPGKAVDFIDVIVDTINDRVIRPVIIAGRSVVFGLLIAALATVFAVLISVALLRLLDVYAFANHVWISYTIIGVAFCGVGLFAWSKRSSGATGTQEQ